MPMDILMGNEAIALGALHAGISAAFAYPGTPSTEIMESLQGFAARGPSAGPERLAAQWCANEKTAYEAALGASFAGRRACVSMKHVGLNVAADPFVNSALLRIKGGLLVVVADDPGMHSSQDEQDSRALAEFARVPCLEPSDQQEAYDMTRAAFDISERYRMPVLLRVTTRLAHGRSAVETAAPPGRNAHSKAEDRWGWTLMPHAARGLWKEVLAKYEALRSESEASAARERGDPLRAVITAGLALEYYRENEAELSGLPAGKPSHLHVDRYPMPYAAIREICATAKRVLIIEEGAPFIERYLRGILPTAIAIEGRESGEIPATGELTPDNVRPALGLGARAGQSAGAFELPRRPPQLCQGCPHLDSYTFLTEALTAYPVHSVNADIGCYTLGALPPLEAIDSVVDMGASIGMARGAAEAGLVPAVAVIGDSTFYHSGITGLVDLAAHGTSATILILDNSTTGMTGAQPTILPSERLSRIALACGVAEEHVVLLSAHKKDHEANVQAMRRELDYQGPSVVISARPCIEAMKKARKA